MADILFVAIMIAFFLLATLFVAACDRIIGPDVAVVAPAEPDEPNEDEIQRAAA